MNNPFEKQPNAGLIAAAVVGSLAAGAIAYLLLSDDGKKAKKKLKAFAKDKVVKAVSDKTGFPKKQLKP